MQSLKKIYAWAQMKVSLFTLDGSKVRRAHGEATSEVANEMEIWMKEG